MNTEQAQEQISALIKMGLRSAQENDPRTLQSAAGRLGPSDIGFCKQKAVLMTKGVKATDSKPMWAAAVGTAVHNWTGAALKQMFPDWIIPMPEDNGKYRVTATLPRTGAQISGTFDTVIPDMNALLDTKTADGFAQIMRYGTSLNHKMQRFLYALGAVDAGILDPDRPILIGNVYLDRSGKNPDPYVLVEEFDPTFIDEVEAWVEDVIYAVRHGEDGEREIAPAVCERICEFYSVCRGSLPSSESEPITDNNLIQAIDMYVEGRNMEKQAKAMKSEAAALLDGINGSDGRFQVRWVETPASEVPGFTRAASRRIDVRAVRRAAR